MQYIGKLMRNVDPEPIKEASPPSSSATPRTAWPCTKASAGASACWPRTARCRTSSSSMPASTCSSCAASVRAARKDAAGAHEQPDKRQGRAFRDLFQFIKAEQLRVEPADE